jgi:hypothetical protein
MEGARRRDVGKRVVVTGRIGNPAYLERRADDAPVYTSSAIGAPSLRMWIGRPEKSGKAAV